MADPTAEELKAAEDAAAKKAADDKAAEEKAAAEAAAAKKDDEWDMERGMATINKLRDELKTAKQDAKKAAELEAKLKEIEDAELSEKEKLEKRLADLEAERLREQEDRQALVLKLAVHSWKPREGSPGLADADLALAALDRAQLEYDDQGSPKNLDDVLIALLEAKPILKAQAGTQTVQAGDTNAGGGTGSAAAPSLTAEELEAAKNLGMTPERYAAFKGKTSIDELKQTSETLEAANAK